ncbi:MAG: hypothetical protein AAGA46_00520 [Cyanobacteria bacterium P01_F01_bin.13]
MLIERGAPILIDDGSQDAVSLVLSQDAPLTTIGASQLPLVAGGFSSDSFSWDNAVNYGRALATKTLALDFGVNFAEIEDEPIPPGRIIVQESIESFPTLPSTWSEKLFLFSTGPNDPRQGSARFLGIVAGKYYRVVINLDTAPPANFDVLRVGTGVQSQASSSVASSIPVSVSNVEVVPPTGNAVENLTLVGQISLSDAGVSGSSLTVTLYSGTSQLGQQTVTTGLDPGAMVSVSFLSVAGTKALDGRTFRIGARIDSGAEIFSDQITPFTTWPADGVLRQEKNGTQTLTAATTNAGATPIFSIDGGIDWQPFNAPFTFTGAETSFSIAWLASARLTDLSLGDGMIGVNVSPPPEAGQLTNFLKGSTKITGTPAPTIDARVQTSAYIESYAATGITSLDMSGVATDGVTVAAEGTVRDCPNLTTVKASTMTTSINALAVDSINLTTADLTGGSAIVRGINAFRGCTKLISVIGLSDCVSIETMAGFLRDCSSVRYVAGTLAPLVKCGNYSNAFLNLSWSQEEVDNCLTDIATAMTAANASGGLAAITTKQVDILFGTSSAPGAAGLAAIATLQGFGFTINTN